MAVHVPGVVPAGAEAPFQALESTAHSPAVGRRPLSIASRPNARSKSPATAGSEVAEPERVGRRHDSGSHRFAAEREETLAQRRFDRNRAIRVSPRERMPPHEEQVEDQHGEPEAVVLRRPRQLVELAALELRRRESGTPPGRGSRARCVIWNESQSMSGTVAWRETTTLPWFTSPITWPWRWTASKAAARLRDARIRKLQPASGNASLRSAGP